MTTPGKKVLLTSSGDKISLNIARHLTQRGCRLVLMGNEGPLRSETEKIKRSLDGFVTVEVVGLDMEGDREAVFDDAVGKAWRILGNLDAFVNCYSYEGKRRFLGILMLFIYLYFVTELLKEAASSNIMGVILYVCIFMNRHTVESSIVMD
ncbi:Hypothetical predicted protein [Olea europaea subsp. europaea]|uniref:Uncharacterized protein n=1 Tax=Olea europaea subsp. europaea TaxID=158383 RepID=A0A8S0T5A5_OLEEU|nr:Hypothetical predicted protein [Olea europaea subsp. europaea]